LPRDLRQRQNRELFRAVNQRIAEIAVGLGVVDETQGFICECSQLGCAEQIQIPLGVYGRVLGMPSAYLVLVGHEDTTSEEVVEAGERYSIVIERHD
jgi:hypothetical protein